VLGNCFDEDLKR